LQSEVEKLLRFYPRIYFACHERHRTEPQSGSELSAHQASILDHLDAVDGMTLGDLAEHMGVTPSTMSIAIGRLERGGYVVRARDDEDRRRLLLTLTEKGERMKEAASVLEPQRVSTLLARLSKQERREALRGLELLAKAADEEIASWSRRSKGDVK
jgi:DNA-binding MarR family transcriptional regulator